jgi:hypothetical protein
VLGAASGGQSKSYPERQNDTKINPLRAFGTPVLFVPEALVHNLVLLGFSVTDHSQVQTS